MPQFIVTVDTVICGKKFKAGDRLIGVPENRIENLLRLGHIEVPKEPDVEAAKEPEKADKPQKTPKADK